MCRAHQVEIVPESQATMALFGRRRPSSWATSCGFIGRPESAAAGEDGNSLPGVEHLGGATQIRLRGHAGTMANDVRGRVARDVARRSILLGLALEIHGEVEVRHAPAADRGPAGEVG